MSVYSQVNSSSRLFLLSVSSLLFSFLHSIADLSSHNASSFFASSLFLSSFCRVALLFATRYFSVNFLSPLHNSSPQPPASRTSRFIMSDTSIRETIEYDDSTPSLTDHVEDATDHTPSPGNDDDDSFGEDFDHADSTSPSVSEDEDNESLPAESNSRTLAGDNLGSPPPKTSRLSQLFTNFADEFLDIIEEDAQEAVIEAAKAQNIDMGKMVKRHDHEIGNLMDEFYDHVSSHEKRAKAESDKVRGEMKSLKRSIDNRDARNSAFQKEVSDRLASLEKRSVDRFLLLEKITSSRMTRLEKDIDARFASLEMSMNDRFAEFEERID
ncbi:uncharacterized protein NECHADRAFT_86928 [Fusarium vanettenii 77-13-4]|uniref:Uncharacterized protein n=1 Tax=Fusarium vanettenii (strain ATCC MYA-4622 / CBS 123669 / FGSC 9596 / NRRL 45880 / 77-13-4) TaxID=660122 RepID=C7ZI06_FUSV7|nr:uncharacterized protein NECHADRAFT_86928 [Fusarium vanettenii 77-13-4]EEU36373.1 predicted protein [Fusarium vanettenii 77-13-4]